MRTNSFLLLAAGLLAACDGPETIHPQMTAESMAMVTPAGTDLRSLRTATEPFHSVPAAEAAGYAIFGGCFADSVLGGMGQHYSNGALIADSTIDALHPELMVYQPSPSGELRLVAVEYLVFQDEWHAKGNIDRPRLFGHDFGLNPTLLQKPFYFLHAWVWKENPSGTFTDWNPRVRCP